MYNHRLNSINGITIIKQFCVSYEADEDVISKNFNEVDRQII